MPQMNNITNLTNTEDHDWSLVVTWRHQSSWCGGFP